MSFYNITDEMKLKYMTFLCSFRPFIYELYLVLLYLIQTTSFHPFLGKFDVELLSNFLTGSLSSLIILGRNVFLQKQKLQGLNNKYFTSVPIKDSKQTKLGLGKRGFSNIGILHIESPTFIR